jgi:uncharacterized protein (DUF1015 family)
MAHLAPFRALRYDPARVAISSVVTQPYDKITPEMQKAYYAASPHNLVRVILGKQQATDQSADNPYTRAAKFFRDWRREGIFLQEAEPSIYLYVQRFTIPGSQTETERRGFIALGRLEDYSAGVVFRHEQTLAKPKADRLELLRATRAHFGQLFMLYSDPAGEIESLLTPSSLPDLETRDEYGVQHQVWEIADTSLINLVRSKMRDKKLIIADGHHRYETAISYRNERRAEEKVPAGGPRRTDAGGVVTIPSDVTEDAPYEQVMMTFINMESSGLVILPTHRVVHGLTDFSAEALREATRHYFSVEEVDPTIDAERARVILREAGRMGTALLGVCANRAFLFDRPKVVDPGLFPGLSLRQQSLDVVQLHKIILEDALRLSEESIRNQQNTRYVREAGEALDQVRRGEANVAFLMNPVRMRQVRDIAFAGEVLPQKSTDFYPKLLSGLTIYALE